jgi:DNA-binding NtrC family response regulator
MRTTSNQRRILVVDESQQALDDLRAVFEDGGFEVMLATNGTKALHLLQGMPASVALVHLTGQERGAGELLEAMARLRPRMPIVVKAADRDDAERLRRRHRNVQAAVDASVLSSQLCTLVDRIVAGDASETPPGLRARWVRVKPDPHAGTSSRSA